MKDCWVGAPMGSLSAHTSRSLLTHTHTLSLSPTHSHTHLQGPFFLGKDLSLVDITFTPMIERMTASIAYYKGYYVRGQGRFPAIER